MSADAHLDLSGHVALVAGKPEHSIDVVVDGLRAAGAAVVLVAPPATQEDAQANVSACVAEHGRLDILICAGRPRTGPALLETDDADILAAWRDVVAPALFLTQAALPHLELQGHGRVVFLSDPAGLLYGHVGSLGAYDMAMGALSAMMRPLAQEGKAAGVATNVVLAVTETTSGTDPRLPLADPSVVAATLWLAGPRCDVSGRFFAVGDGRMSEVFINVGPGYQSPVPPQLSIEEVATNWASALHFEGGMSPADQVEYHGFRTQIYRAHVKQ